MSELIAKYRGRWNPGNRDAKAVAMVLYNGDEYFQFVVVLISGITLMTSGHGASPEPFWSDLARSAQWWIEDALREGTIPLDDPTRAFEVFVPNADLPSGPALTEGDEVFRVSFQNEPSG